MTDLLIETMENYFLKKICYSASRMEMLVNQVGCYLTDNLHILGVIINQPFNLLQDILVDELPKTIAYNWNFKL